MFLTNFHEKTICPEMPCEKGGYRKSPVKVDDVLDERKEAAHAKQLAELEKYKSMQEADNSSHNEPNIPLPAVTSEPQEEYLPRLKPGIDGKIDWAPLASLTETRPSVNKYSISRYSQAEWRKYNKDLLNCDSIVESNILNYNAQTAAASAFGNMDKVQTQNTNRLKQKAKDLYRWKTEVEISCKAIAKEVELLEFERQRIKGASRVLMLPESISRECIDLRSNRAEPDLVMDLPEQELRKEMELLNEVRVTLKSTLWKIEEQLKINKAVKHRIEYDWCDKTMAYDIDTNNIGLNVKSNTIMFKFGATKFGEMSAPLAYWEYYCRENIEQVEAARQASADLRSTLNAMLINNGRKLRQQADRTDTALAETVALTSELVTKLEEHLRFTLISIADVETLIQNLQDSVRKTDRAMKLAQTRMDNRNVRHHGENVRDQAHIGLIQEVKTIHEGVTSLLGQLHDAEESRKRLMERRKELETNLAYKKKTLNIDRDRCGLVRSHYPSASELAGF